VLALSKTTDSLVARLAELEEAVYHQGKAIPIFQEIRKKITDNEALRKKEDEKLS
jgi:ribosomal protein S24E